MNNSIALPSGATELHELQLLLKGGGFFEDVGDWFSDAADWTGDTWSDFTDWTGDTWSDFTDWTGDTWSDFTDWTGDTWTDISGWTSNAWEGTVDWVQGSLAMQSEAMAFQSQIEMQGAEATMNAGLDFVAALDRYLTANPYSQVFTPDAPAVAGGALEVLNEARTAVLAGEAFTAMLGLSWAAAAVVVGAGVSTLEYWGTAFGHAAGEVIEGH